MDEVLLDGHHLLRVGAEGLLALRALILTADQVRPQGDLLLFVLGKHEVVADVHESCNPLQKVGGGRAADHQTPILLLLLTTVVERGVDHGASCALGGLLGVLRVVHLRGSCPCGVVFLRRALSASAAVLPTFVTSIADVSVLTKRSLDKMAVGIDVSASTCGELRDVVGSLDKLFVDIHIGFVLLEG